MIEQSIIDALALLSVAQQNNLSNIARQAICWHDPIAVELNRRLTAPLLEQLTTAQLQELLDMQDESTIINDLILSLG